MIKYLQLFYLYEQWGQVLSFAYFTSDLVEQDVVRAPCVTANNGSGHETIFLQEPSYIFSSFQRRLHKRYRPIWLKNPLRR